MSTGCVFGFPAEVFRVKRHSAHFQPTVPAKAGTQPLFGISGGVDTAYSAWVPAFAGTIGWQKGFLT